MTIIYLFISRLSQQRDVRLARLVNGCRSSSENKYSSDDSFITITSGNNTLTKVIFFNILGLISLVESQNRTTILFQIIIEHF